MAPVTVLSLLVEELNNGRIKVVDLTQPLGPETPVIGLPPIFASSPPFSREVISRYDDKGPAGIGTPSTWASTPARTSTRPSTGSPGRIWPTTRSTPSRRASLLGRPA